jgi:hypothetical protein
MPENEALISQLRDAIKVIPLIDNHAHNLLQSYESPDDFSREMLFSGDTG